MIRLGYEILAENGAGARAQFPDEAYEAAGARLAGGARVRDCEVAVSASAPAEERLTLMSRGAILICRLDPARHPGLLESLRKCDITALALGVVPRVSQAQSLDMLSSQANLAGYRAIIEATFHLGRLFGGQVTTAGRFPSATIYVIGASVTGLSAIGTIYSLDAQVRGSDIRPEVADQVRSMGAQLVSLPSTQEVSSNGYAKEMSADQTSAARALYAQQAAESDVVITTASVPGRHVPVFLDRSAVKTVRPGSIIIDMAAATSDNTELTMPDQVVATDGGVTIAGHTDLAGVLPTRATQLYGHNIVSLLDLVTPDKDGTLTLDLGDEVVRVVTVTHDGELLWSSPSIQTSAVPVASQPKRTAAGNAADQETTRAAQAHSRSRQWLGLAAATLVATTLVLVTPSAATNRYIVLMPSMILDFHVISNVTPALHTPLMSVTNVISGIILVGAISQVGHLRPLISAISLTVVILVAVSIVGGFAIIHHMLATFTKDRGEGQITTHILMPATSSSILIAAVPLLPSPVVLAYIAAAILFILAAAGLSHHETAVAGNMTGAVGMGVAVLAAIGPALNNHPARGILPMLLLIAVGLALDSVIGLVMARRVAMTGMPQLIAVLNGLVGLAAVLVGYNSYVSPDVLSASLNAFHLGKVFLGVLVSGVTFTGSILAVTKLAGRVPGRPLTLPGRSLLSLGTLIGSLVFMVESMMAPAGSVAGWALLAVMTLIALALGVHLVLAIGGGDMSVVVSIMNSYSGWASVSTGFMVDNDLLIITGALVGSSGVYLSYLMCQAMNRSFVSVLLRGYGADSTNAASGGSGQEGTVHEITTGEVAHLLQSARRVVITPGYGTTVAQVQYPVATLIETLRSKDVEVTFDIRPVMGRLPGRMNVLLAEAKVPCDTVLEMDEVNNPFDEIDVVFVVDANDTVNPTAQEPGSPTAGMPVLHIWETSRVIVFKHSMATGYTGMNSPLSFRENSSMLFGDAKDAVGTIIHALE